MIARRRLAANWLLMAALFGVTLSTAFVVHARPGSGAGVGRSGGVRGASFGAGIRHTGGSGGDVTVALPGLLAALVILTVGAAIKAVKTEQVYDSHDELEPDSGPIFVRRVDWAPLVARDPQFSPFVFEEFVRRLYARAHEARGDAQALAELAQYLSDEARKALATRELTGVRINNVVIGNLQVLSLQVGPEVTRIDVRFQSNVSAEGASWYLLEEWQLVRDTGVQSKPLEQARALSCVVGGGRFDWFVIGTRMREAQWQPPKLGRHRPEEGTNLPTLVSPSFDEQWAALLAEDPKLERDALFARIHAIYERINTAWTAREPEIVRAWVTDGVYDSLTYWVEAQRRQGVINCHENEQITRIELVKLQRDPWFDALTVRIFARGLDYTIRESDDWVVGGSTSSLRHYSEYWTLIRDRSKARAGEVDWVLSRIEQDEGYLG